jgi:hypothetical protein
MVLIASAVMGLSLLAMRELIGWDETGRLAGKCLRLAFWIGAGGGIYFLACFLCRVRELNTITKSVIRRVSPGKTPASGAED